MHLRYFARTWTAWQEGKLGKAISSVMGRHVRDIAARLVGKRSAHRQAPCLRVLRKPKALIVIVVTLVAYGCPIQAIVHAFGLDSLHGGKLARSSGKHCQEVHQAVVLQGHLDLVQGPR